jgi:hypothetical protein
MKLATTYRRSLAVSPEVFSRTIALRTVIVERVAAIRRPHGEIEARCITLHALKHVNHPEVR